MRGRESEKLVDKLPVIAFICHSGEDFIACKCICGREVAVSEGT